MMQKLGLWVALCVGLSLSGGGALAQANSQAQATLERLLGNTYSCGNWGIAFVYREGQGSTGWFRQRKSRSGRLVAEYDVSIRGEFANEIRIRSVRLESPGASQYAINERIRVMEGAEAVKIFDAWDELRQRIATLTCERV